ncbi:outer membrane beta-barrel protein [Candidatus Palauibacter sp.]|uniref:outer membrane beta-barrel protein n=1 Tax=Candidatus Palauibacter sp. TaxID=3101350 RepID=UPI003AF21B61
MRRILTSLLPLLVAAPLMGQTMVGVRAGLNRSTISVEDSSDQDARMGMIAGIDVALPLASAVELRVGGAYAQKGSGASEEGFGSFSLQSFSLQMDYFQLSALARMGSPRDGGLSAGVLLGPWAAFNLSCDVSASLDLGEFGSTNVSESCRDDTIAGEVQGTDFGIAAGAGVELAVSEGLRVGLDLVYSIGLAELGGDGGIKNRSLAVQAGVVIPFGG